jgi:hypothetical protein
MTDEELAFGEQHDESDLHAIHQAEEIICTLATNILEKIANGQIDVVEGSTKKQFLMMRIAQYKEQSRRI